MSDTPATQVQPVERMSGMVKWFNNKAGFGFITVCAPSDKKGKDIFVHYSAIRVTDSQYKYLVQGEYVDFDLVLSKNGDHEFNAADVCGIGGGPIMCESRRLALSTQVPEQTQGRKYKVRESRDTDAATGSGADSSAPVRRRPARPPQQQQQQQEDSTFTKVERRKPTKN